MTFRASLLTLLLATLGTNAQDRADLIIRNGRIIDGTGNSWYRADIAVGNGRILAIGKNLPHAAPREIDAKQQFVTPGFIDVHAHIEGGIFERPTADNYLREFIR